MVKREVELSIQETLILGTLLAGGIKRDVSINDLHNVLTQNKLIPQLSKYNFQDQRNLLVIYLCQRVRPRRYQVFIKKSGGGRGRKTKEKDRLTFRLNTSFSSQFVPLFMRDFEPFILDYLKVR